MFDFLKKNDSEEDVIEKIMESEDFKKLLEQSFKTPGETITMCIMVMSISLNEQGVSLEMFEEILRLMKKSYSELPSPILMKSMREYGLI